jgi:hypothetical protein
MKMQTKPRVPSLRLHKPSGQAVVTIAGRDHYCGPWGSRKAQAEYQRLVGEWLAGGRLCARDARRTRSSGCSKRLVAGSSKSHLLRVLVRQ